jgi:hypothetical protein
VRALGQRLCRSEGQPALDGGQQDRSMTFDVGVVDLPASYRYGMEADAYNMIYVDADGRPGQDGLVIAPCLNFEPCDKKYA